MTTSDSKISAKFKRLNNARIGKLFEKNINEVLKIEYGWKIPKIQRHFFFRKVFHDGIKDFIITGKTKRLVIRNQNFLFKFKENDKLSIKDENLGLKVKIPIKKNEQIEFPIKNE